MMKTLKLKFCWSVLGLGLMGYASGCADAVSESPCVTERRAAANNCRMSVESVYFERAAAPDPGFYDELLEYCCAESLVRSEAALLRDSECLIESFRNDDICNDPRGSGLVFQRGPDGLHVVQLGSDSPSGGDGGTPSSPGTSPGATPVPESSPGGGSQAGGAQPGGGQPPAGPVCDPDPVVVAPQIASGAIPLDPARDLPKCGPLGELGCFASMTPTWEQVFNWIGDPMGASPCVNAFGSDYCSRLSEFCGANFSSFPSADGN